VYIFDKKISLRGGYTTTNWMVSDPVANPTTLDALGQGWVVVVYEATVVVEGFNITGGHGGLWADVGAERNGVGVIVNDAVVYLVSNRIFENVEGCWGGGVAVVGDSQAHLQDNVIISNTADVGGGVFALPWFEEIEVTTCRDVITGNVDGNVAGNVSEWCFETGPAVGVEKRVSSRLAESGDVLTYTLMVTNAGYVEELHATVTDMLPGELELVGTSGNALTGTDGGVIIWTVRLAPREVWSATVVARVVTGYVEGFINTMCVATTEGVSGSAEVEVGIAREWVFLPFTVKNPTPSSPSLPVYIGEAIPQRPAEQGEVFYTTQVRIPADIPDTGRFYLSSRQDAVIEVLVDDEIVISCYQGTDAEVKEVWSHAFVGSGGPEPAMVEVPRQVVEEVVGRIIVVEYWDLYGVQVEATTMWLIWVP
jgi:uncharacterized repeat protein (TIGR01451 family)